MFLFIGEDMQLGMDSFAIVDACERRERRERQLLRAGCGRAVAVIGENHNAARNYVFNDPSGLA
jgi:hypothetical protein